LVRVALNENPPRSGCGGPGFEPETSRTVRNKSGAGEPTLVWKEPPDAPVSDKPDGASVTVAAGGLLYPGALALYVTVPELPSACKKYCPSLAPAGIVIIFVPDPAVVALSDMSSRPESLLLSVTCRPPAGAGWLRLIKPASSRFWPIITPSVMLNVGVLTVAVRVRELAGVAKPAGTPAVISVLPFARG